MGAQSGASSLVGIGPALVLEQSLGQRPEVADLLLTDSRQVQWRNETFVQVSWTRWSCYIAARPTMRLPYGTHFANSVTFDDKCSGT